MKWIILPLLMLVSACSNAPDDDAITMSVIGGPVRMVDPGSAPLDTVAAILALSTAQGLVAFDASGRIEPALAERWIVTDDGLSIIFRIRRTTWADGRPVTSADVAASLTRAMTVSRRTTRMFEGVDRIIGMTGQVIEMRLKSPQPSLLQTLAQPEMALFRVRISRGSGPYRIHSARDGVTRLRLSPSFVDGDEARANERDDIRIRGERASLAAARFVAGDAALVTGGTVADLPYARAAKVSSAEFRVDPAYGLFGLAFVAQNGPFANSNARRALAMAIDREALVRRFGVNSWRPIYAVLPAQMDGALAPAALDWVQLSLSERRARARSYLASQSALPAVRLWLPEGPGTRLLFASLAADWATIGVRVERVPIRAVADLRLIDEIAPHSSALWYFDRLSCARGLPCSPEAQSALNAALSATTLTERAQAIAQTDAAYAANQGYIPLALPLRWSLVAPGLTGWQPSAFAIHPLARLRIPSGN